MPSISSTPGKLQGGKYGKLPGGKPSQVESSLGTSKRSNASFKRRKRNKENVEPPLETVEKLLKKSKVDLCSPEKRLRCVRHKIGKDSHDNGLYV